MTEIVSIPAIVIACYLVGIGCKAVGNAKLDKFIPTICGVVGGILGIATFLTIPNFIPGDNWAIALATGIASGFAATGVNQVIKQFSKGV